MKFHLSIITIAFLVTGCVSKEVMLVNPETSQSYDCRASGWGWFGAPYAAHTFNQCVSTLRANGYQYPYEVPNTQQQPASPQKSNLDQHKPAVITPRMSNVREAKVAYKNGQIEKYEYKLIISQLKSEYKKKVAQIRLEYAAQKFDKLEYKKRIAITKIDYAG